MPLDPRTPKPVRGAELSPAEGLNPRTPGLLSLLPEGALEKLREIDVSRITPRPHAERIADYADNVVRGHGVGFPGVAYLLLLLIEQAKRCEALEVILDTLEQEAQDRDASRLRRIGALEAGLRPFAEAPPGASGRPYPQEREPHFPVADPLNPTGGTTTVNQPHKENDNGHAREVHGVPEAGDGRGPRDRRVEAGGRRRVDAAGVDHAVCDERGRPEAVRGGEELLRGLQPSGVAAPPGGEPSEAEELEWRLRHQPEEVRIEAVQDWCVALDGDPCSRREARDLLARLAALPLATEPDEAVVEAVVEAVAERLRLAYEAGRDAGRPPRWTPIKAAHTAEARDLLSSIRTLAALPVVGGEPYRVFVAPGGRGESYERWMGRNGLEGLRLGNEAYAPALSTKPSDYYAYRVRVTVLPAPAESGGGQ